MKDADLLLSGKTLISEESHALQKTIESLNHSFVQAVRILGDIQGRIITSGMGKSGIIARKIAATLSSTGNPAFFLHPAEASHGDLGALYENDALLVLSNSGETPELFDIVNYALRFKIPLVGITATPHSTLATQSTQCIIYPVKEEAGHLMAPTTSTTQQIALGDALAITLAKYKNFSNVDMSILHPRGELGQQLTYIQSIMLKHLPLATKHTSIEEIAKIMTLGKLGCAGIVDSQEKLIGIITDGDIRRNIGIQKTEEAYKIMSHNPLTLSPNQVAGEALYFLQTRKINVAFVVTPSHKPVGLIHIQMLVTLKIA